ncbi:Conjugative transposon protein, Antirestriction protein [Lactococcus lactis subsp. lactis A12]|uniref:Conjugative transposon protein, Antirestriction protein n=2 Tax=Lactococcus lactis TaxID=1358 RepID=S6EQZ1_LACLL|nr:Conjugative transposon protein, Antirestriction protein [Lactococcus lactis subsp. lactis A12]SBW29612.1 Conjugative transposon protein, Antirestriction protein [Lactococcus lactis subsp. lactis]
MTQKNSRTGQWFDLPSPEFERRLKWLGSKGIEPVVLDITGDVPFSVLKHIKVSDLNEVAQALEELDVEIIENLETFLAYETLEELIESDGKHFFFHGGDGMTEIAENLVKNGEISPYIDESDLMADYLDFEAIGRDLENSYNFFELPDGEMVEYVD